MSSKIEDMFNYLWFSYDFLFLIIMLAMQTAGLYDSSAVQGLNTAVQCLLHDAYFESCVSSKFVLQKIPMSSNEALTVGHHV